MLWAELNYKGERIRALRRGIVTVEEASRHLPDIDSFSEETESEEETESASVDIGNALERENIGSMDKPKVPFVFSQLNFLTCYFCFQ